MFFDHLDRVITSNTTGLELVKNKLSSIIPETEKYLAFSNLPRELTTRLHQQFLSQCNPEESSTPRPELQKKQSMSNPQKATQLGKRKRGSQPPSTKKPATSLSSPSHPSSSQNPFLSKGHQPPLEPT